MAARILLILNGLAFAGTAVWALLQPAAAAEALHLGVAGAAAHHEFLATFGGVYLLLGLVFLMPRPFDVAARLAILVVVCGGLTFGRLWALARHGLPEPVQWGYLAWEAASALLAAILLARIMREEPEE